jgi:hypothetical protein
MIGHVIDVEYEDGTVNIAKIVSDENTEYMVKPLVNVYDYVYKFSRFPHSIPKEAVAGFYDTTNLEDTGLFSKIDDTYYESLDTSDCDYECESIDSEY